MIQIQYSGMAESTWNHDLHDIFDVVNEPVCLKTARDLCPLASSLVGDSPSEMPFDQACSVLEDLLQYLEEACPVSASYLAAVSAIVEIAEHHSELTHVATALMDMDNVYKLLSNCVEVVAACSASSSWHLATSLSTSCVDAMLLSPSRSPFIACLSTWASDMLDKHVLDSIGGSIEPNLPFDLVNFVIAYANGGEWAAILRTWHDTVMSVVTKHRERSVSCIQRCYSQVKTCLRSNVDVARSITQWRVMVEHLLIICYLIPQVGNEAHDRTKFNEFCISLTPESVFGEHSNTLESADVTRIRIGCSPLREHMATANTQGTLVPEWCGQKLDAEAEVPCCMCAVLMEVVQATLDRMRSVSEHRGASAVLCVALRMMEQESTHRGGKWCDCHTALPEFMDGVRCDTEKINWCLLARTAKPSTILPQHVLQQLFDRCARNEPPCCMGLLHPVVNSTLEALYARQVGEFPSSNASQVTSSALTATSTISHSTKTLFSLRSPAMSPILSSPPSQRMRLTATPYMLRTEVSPRNSSSVATSCLSVTKIQADTSMRMLFSQQMPIMNVLPLDNFAVQNESRKESGKPKTPAPSIETNNENAHMHGAAAQHTKFLAPKRRHADVMLDNIRTPGIEEKHPQTTAGLKHNKPKRGTTQMKSGFGTLTLTKIS